jgi:hypothetical protein
MVNNIFNNNHRNSRTLIADEIYIAGGVKNQQLIIDENGLVKPTTFSEISTINKTRGITIDDMLKGFSFLESNQKDESPLLNDFVNNVNNEFSDLGLSNISKTILIESPTGYLYLNDIISVPAFCSIDFKNTVCAIGTDFRLSIQGSYEVEPTNLNLAPRVTVKALQGQKILRVSDSNYVNGWNVGNFLAIRSELLDKRIDNVLVGKSNVSTNLWDLYLKNEIDDFDIEIGGTVRKYLASLLNSNIARGDTRLYVKDASIFQVKDYVAIQDQRLCGDFYGTPSNVVNSNNSRFWYSANTIMNEIKQVVNVVYTPSNIFDLFTGYIDLNSPMCKTTDTINGNVKILRPKENVDVNNFKCFNIEPLTIASPRKNNHPITCDTLINSSIRNCKFSDSWDFLNLGASNVVQSGLLDNFIRVRESYRCLVDNITYLRQTNINSGSGASYGVTCYLSSFCQFNNLFIEGCRHNILWQCVDNISLTNSVFKNVFISALDFHGLGEFDCKTDNVYIEFAQQNGFETNGSIAARNISALKCGNTTHMFGSSYNNFNNIRIKGFMNNSNNSNINTGIGIDIQPVSSHNSFNNVIIEDCDIAIQQLDYTRGRLLGSGDSNIYQNLIVKNCRQLIDFEGDSRNSNEFHYLLTQTSNVNSNSLQLLSTSNSTNFNQIYNGWTAVIGSSNYRVQNYAFSNKTIVFTSNLSPLPSNGETIALHNSLSNTIYPTRDVHIMNSTFINSSNAVLLNGVDRAYFINNFFNSNTHSSTSTSRFVFGLSNCRNFTISDNVCLNNRKFLNMLGAVSNITVVNNTLINQRETNVYDTTGSNWNIAFSENKYIGFTPSFTTSTPSTYQTPNSNLGIGNLLGNPRNFIMNVNQINGSVGIGTITPNSNARLHIFQNSNTPFMLFDNSNNTSASNLNTTALGSYYGRILVNIQGVGDRYIALYN